MKNWIVKNWLIILLPIVYLVFILSTFNSKIAANNHNLIITLTAIENWQNDGVATHDFNLIHSWGNNGDKDVHYYPRVMNEQGRNYFVSYPPLSYLLFYGVVQILQPNDLVVTFKIWGALIHMLTFLTLVWFLRKKGFVQLTAIIAGIFLFFPASIVLSNMYYPEQLIILLILLFVVGLEIVSSKWLNLFLFISSAILIYCDWLGGLMVASFSIYQFWKKEKGLFFVILGGLLGALILVWQYSLIAGLDGLFHGLKIRYLERSGIFPTEYSDRGVNLVSNSGDYILSHLLPTVFGAAIFLIILRMKFSKQLIQEKTFWVLIAPVVLHMIFLFNSNILHFQNLAKLGLIFVGLIVITPVLKPINHYLKIFGIVLNVGLSILIVNSYFEKYSSNDSIYEKAEFIKKLNDPEKVMVMIQPDFSEDLVLLSYLTKRNLIWRENEQEVLNYLKNSDQQSSAVWIDWSKQSNGIIQE